jgi:hypothetical protein
MGRPIKKKFFGNINPTQYGSHVQGTGVGGEGVASVAVSGTFEGKTTATTYTIPASVIGAPNITGGEKPTMTISFASTTSGAVTVLTPGSGYTSAPAISGAALQALGGGTGTVVLTATISTSIHDAIQITSYIPGGGAARTGGDIIKQESSRRYLVQNSDGVGACTLVADDPAAGEMNIIATDAGGATYYVTKLTGRKATLTNKTDTSTAYYVSGEVAPWTIDSASGSTAPTAIVSISNTN